MSSPAANPKRIRTFRRTRHFKRRLFELILAVCFIIAGLSVLFFIISSVFESQAKIRNEYRQIQASVITVGVGKKESADRRDYLYRPEVQIEYRINDISYRVWTYDPEFFNNKGYIYDKEEVVYLLSKYKAGQTVNCWYDPKEPSKAIVSTGLTWTHILYLCMAITCIVIGGLQMMHLLLTLSFFRKGFKEPGVKGKVESGVEETELERLADSRYSAMPDFELLKDSPGTRQAYRLPVIHSPLVPVIIQIILSVGWIVLLVIVLLRSIISEKNLAPDFFSVVCMALAGIVGTAWLLWNLGRFVYLCSFTSPIIELRDMPVVLGQVNQLSIQQKGRHKFRYLRISAVSKELVQVASGTDMRIMEQVIEPVCVLFERTDFETLPGKPMSETIDFVIDSRYMHTFIALHNQIQWYIQVDCEVADLGTFTQNYDITVIAPERPTTPENLL